MKLPLSLILSFVKVVDFLWAKFSDGLLTVGLEPPTAIGGWDVRFVVFNRFGGGAGDGIGSGLITKSMASGFYGVSGMNIVNSGQGQFQVTLTSNDTSGLPFGAYAATISRFGSGVRVPLDEGFLIITP